MLYKTEHYRKNKIKWSTKKKSYLHKRKILRTHRTDNRGQIWNWAQNACCTCRCVAVAGLGAVADDTDYDAEREMAIYDDFGVIHDSVGIIAVQLYGADRRRAHLEQMWKKIP